MVLAVEAPMSSAGTDSRLVIVNAPIISEGADSKFWVANAPMTHARSVSMALVVDAPMACTRADLLAGYGSRCSDSSCSGLFDGRLLWL